MQLQNQFTSCAFAAILADGSVVDQQCGGDSSAVDLQLPNCHDQTHDRPSQFKIGSGVCSRFRRRKGHLLRSWQTDQSLPGVIKGVVTLSGDGLRISSRVCNYRFNSQVAHLLRFWQMVQWLINSVVVHNLAVTLLLFKISSGVCSRFRRQNAIVWQMVQWVPGAINGVVVTVLMRTASALCAHQHCHHYTIHAQFQSTSCAFAAILADGSVVTWSHGIRWATAQQFYI